MRIVALVSKQTEMNKKQIYLFLLFFLGQQKNLTKKCPQKAEGERKVSQRGAEGEVRRLRAQNVTQTHRDTHTDTDT